MKKIIYENKNIIVIIIIAFFSCFYYYDDANSIIRQGINVWKALFEGNFFEYYSINIQSFNKGEMIHYANYSMGLNLIMGIWQIPLYFIERFFNINVLDYFIFRAYGKMYAIVAAYIASVVIEKMVKELTGDQEKAEKSSFYFLISAFTMVSISNIGQVDIIGIIFVSLAFLFLFKRDIVKFLIFFIIAAQCKNFALFIFVPVILYYEKNIIKSGLYIISPLVVQYLIELPFKIIDPISTSIQDDKMVGSIGALLAYKINIYGKSATPLFYLIFVSICLIAYIKKKDEEMEKKWELYFGFVSIFFTLVILGAHTYWYVYLAFFLSVCLFIEKTDIDKKLFLYYISTISCFIEEIIMINWFFWKDNLKGMLLDIVYKVNYDIDIIKYYTGIISTDTRRFIYIDQFLYMVFFVCCLLFLYMIFPKKIIRQNDIETKVEQSFLEKNTWIIGTTMFLLCNCSIILSIIF